MVFRPFEVNVPHIVYACLGGFVVLFGMFSLFLRERLYIGEACWAFLFGIIIGPYGAGIFDPHSWGDNSDETTNAITLEFTRVVLAIGVFAIGVELPKAYMKRHWKSLFFMLGPIMTWGWFVSAAFIFALVPGLNFLSSLCVAACLTPTDPILAAAVIGGKYADKHVPAHIRHLLAAESGCNDGAAFPFLYIALYLMIDRTTGTAIKDWFLLLWLYQVVLGVVIGALLGIGFRYLMKFCEGHNLIDRHSYVAQYVSLAIFTIGVVVLLGSDDLLSTFACGTAFAWDGFFNRQTEESVFSSVIDLLFNIAAFVYVGAWMPFGTFTMKEELTLEVWRLIVIAILVLLFRRLPAMIACYKWMPDIKTFREALFSGHFGPIGIGAVFISTLAAEVLNEHINEVDAEGDSVSSGEGTTGTGESISDQMRLLARTIQPITAFMVLCSITIHGLSIPGFSLSRRIHSRTFSRRTTIGAETGDGGGGRRLPEWATQVRQVGEGVVINKDPEHMNRNGRDEVDRAERGESSLSEKRSEGDENEKASQGESPGESTVLEKPGVIAVDHAKRPSRDEEEDIDSDALAPAHAERLPAGEVPPDGPEDEVIEEWQEGPHRVVERRRGPGEEVEVEVVKNWFYNGHGSHMSASASGLLLGGGGRSRKDSGASRKSAHGDHSHESKVFRGTKSSVRREVKDYIAVLSGIEKKAVKEVEKAEEKVEEGVKKAGEEVKEVVEGRPSQASEQDEEEGWASDHSNSGGSSQPLATASTSRSKSPRTKSIAVGAMRKKSVRKGTGLMGRVMRRTRTREEEQAPEEEEEERGRRGRGSISTPRVIEPSSSPPSASTSSGIKVYPTRTRSRSPLSPLASPSSPVFSESGNQSPGGHRRSYSGQLALSPQGQGQGGERGREAGRERERGAGGGRLRHHRLDSLRVNEPTGLSSREQSPARSIRFFDEPQQPSSPLPYRDSFGGTGGGSGPGTPMHGD
ncbi:hypothetical protein VKT23_004905 [Stygiomarasmius scandens]|uniref:Cation/H+ exchanger transmembrane domain-containing protein n=1 Tax=Marasmiellus scandens TaxID=2682957 RepID=A0ABR1JW93_9AGAR